MPVWVTLDHAVVLPEDVTLNVNCVACPALDTELSWYVKGATPFDALL